eukprot:CAMPEP_0185034404 /NCGR_PEP_ID=MMETSP1103-20130426/24264_1 /TAXON_ID=36769 /ORGANISM="Paraphysomonas bandaiensis, Strain Caron Lab Isolate" /LENGTH=1244 /DNA_ID=CAMNT_0027571049 /DNA_START=102 /DNA_END=3836 /DNA_ORIENTATION=+
MMCQNNCATTVHNALMSVHGVDSADVSFPSHSARVVGTASVNDLIEAVESVGFDACLIENSPPTHVFTVMGMMCQKNCGTTVENALRSVPGVLWAKAEFAKQMAMVWGNVDEKLLVEAVEDVGFDILPDGPVSKSRSNSHNGNGMEQPDSVLHIKRRLNPLLDVSKLQEKALSLDGVVSVEIEYSKSLVKLWGFADPSAVAKELSTGGYPCDAYSTMQEAQDAIARKETLESVSHSDSDCNTINNGNIYVLCLKVGGMSCANCSKAVETNLLKIDGVASVRVALLSGAVEVTYDAVVVGDPERLSMTIRNLGYSSTMEVEPRKLGSTVRLSRTLRLHITGMSSSNCAKRIESTLSSLPGVTEACVSCMDNKATIKLHDSTSEAVGPRKVIQVIRDMGYFCEHIPDTDDRNSDKNRSVDADTNEWQRLLIIACALGIPVVLLHIAMMCSSRVMMLLTLPGMCSGGVTVGQMIMVCLNLPMQVIVGHRFYRAAIMGAIHGSYGMDCLVVTGTTITFLYSSIELFFSCMAHKPSMHVFFETSGMLLLFVTLGKYLEAYAKGSTTSAMTSLLKLQPRKATLVVNSDDIICNNTQSNKWSSPIGSSGVDDVMALNIDHIEELQEIDIDLVQRNDIIKVYPGERVPTDGEVVRGSSYVDESLITGESVPVMRGVGSSLYGSTINQKGVLYVRVTSLGSESALSQIIQLVEAAQMNKAPIQAYADVVAGVFTPCVLFLALLTFMVWFFFSSTHRVPLGWYNEAGYGHDPLLFSLLFCISVVVISCPCALGLATPTAIMVGTSVGATNGVLIKGGPPFEVAHKVNTVIFDKTGTLTLGKPTVTDELVLTDDTAVIQSGGALESEQRAHMLRLAALAEQNSEHPLASAIITAAKDRHIIPPDNSSAKYGMHTGGVSCTFPDGTCVLVGNRVHMETHHITLGPVIDAAMWDLEVQGKTAVCVAFNSAIIGVLGIADIIKPEACTAIAALKRMGIDIWMVTGDNRTTAEAIGDELHIPQDRIVAGALPADKVRKVLELQRAGGCVAMVGDGINDSPAISQSDLGIAVGAGTHIAIDAADMVVVRNNLHDVVVALDLAKVVFGRIRLNLLWALMYNVLAIPVAAGIIFPITHSILPPQYAGLCMALSSISVVVSSISLKLYKRPILQVDQSDETSNQNPSTGTSIIGRARGRLNRLKEDLSRKIDHFRHSGKYSPLPAVESDDDLGLQLGLGGLGGLPASLEYDNEEEEYRFNRVV